MKKIVQEIENFNSELKKNKLIKNAGIQYYDSPANLEQVNELEQTGKIEKSVLDFYRLSDGFAIKWEASNSRMVSEDVFGAVNINPFQNVVRKWNGIVYFDDEPDNSPRRKFFPTDFFSDEAAAGFCTLEGYRSSIYYFKFEGNLIPLYVNFQDYLQLMIFAKGCCYWQYLIFEIIDKDENNVSKRIKSDLPLLFPDFSYSQFVNYFNANRKK